jgi:hypothetical protein
MNEGAASRGLFISFVTLIFISLKLQHKSSPSKVINTNPNLKQEVLLCRHSYPKHKRIRMTSESTNDGLLINLLNPTKCSKYVEKRKETLNDLTESI